MNKTLFLIAILTLAGCGSDEVLIQGLNGPAGQNGTNGADGKDGANGHSLVSQYVSASEFECETSGSRLDIYIDLDDSLSVSENDLFSNSLIACNGANGLNGLNGSDGSQGIQGTQGPQGVAGAIGPQGAAGANGLPGPQGLPGEQGAPGEQGLPGADGSSGASIVSYTSSSCTAITGTSYYTKPNGTNTKIYTGSTCSSGTSVEELGDGDSFWVASNKLAVDFGDTGIRVITFN